MTSKCSKSANNSAMGESKVAAKKKSAPKQSKVRTRLVQENQQNQLTETIPSKLIEHCFRSGQLNLSNRNLTAIPERLWTFDRQESSASNVKHGLSTDQVPDFDRKKQGAKNEEEKEEGESSCSWWNREPLRRLLLANNQLVNIDPRINQFGMLAMLDLSHNCLTDLPESIGDCLHLQKLLLSYNALKQLPVNIGKLIDLLIFKVDNNSLMDLPKSLQQCGYIEELDISNNQLTALPVNLFDGCRRLRTLKLNKNRLKSLPPDIGWLQNLNALDVSSNEIGPVLSGEIGELGHLQVLNAQSNRLTTVASFEQCYELKELELANNEIKNLPEDLFNSLKSLSVLDLRHNKLTGLPNSLFLVNSLQRLYVDGNNLTSLPLDLAKMTNLKTLTANNNPIRTIRRDIIQRGSEELLKYLRNKLGDEVEDFDQINREKSLSIVSDAIRSRRLDLSNGQMTSISEESLEKVSRNEVHTIDLSGNTLSSLPIWLEKFYKSLFELSVQKNNLSLIAPDSSICKLKWMSTLNLSLNRLSHLPIELAQCTNLVHLDISCNVFTSFPDVIFLLLKLESLLASDNKIATVCPEKLINLNHLINLDLTNNQLTSVPPDLGLLKQLRSLKLDGNGLKVPRAQTLAKGTKEVLKYLRSRIPDYIEDD